MSAYAPLPECCSRYNKRWTVLSLIIVPFISSKSGVGRQLWLIGLGVLLPGLEAHVYVAGNQP